MKVLRCSLKASAYFIVCMFLIVIGGIERAEAITIINKSGMVGVTTGQTLRINIANVGNELSGIAPCVIVFDTSGNQLARIDGDPLFPDKAVSFDYVLPADNSRTELRALIQLEDREETSGKHLRGRVRLTVEVFDNATSGTVAIIDDGKLSD